MRLLIAFIIYTFSYLVGLSSEFVPFCVNSFWLLSPYPPLFRHIPRLDSTVDCVTIFIFAEPYIIDCVALLYHVLLLFSYSVNYCTLHILRGDSKFRGLVG